MSARTILYGQGDVNGIITPLIPFNCVYDLDFGLIRFMYENGYTNNDDMLDPSFFKPFETDLRKIIIKLYNRKTENPLELFLNNVNEADDLYNQFMRDKYEPIIRSAVHTGIYEMITTFKSEKSIKASIIYSNEAEYYMLKEDKLLKHVEFIDLENLLPRVKAKEFNAVFFKSLDDMYIDLLAKYITSSTVYILDYSFNFEDEALRNTSYNAVLRINRNDINIISVYDRSRLGMEEIN